jgi:hypothetical protein
MGYPEQDSLHFSRLHQRTQQGLGSVRVFGKKSLVTQQNLLEKIPNCHKFTTGLIKRQMGFKNSVK